ncbi:MAG TPA: MarR family winged helix-turn-helix transcriptional regulator [Candidatus Acidoferrales bacterium]|jgi:DNA-binding MarR family transcriptional regulator|nr:MarR family winged helix-turn-helix transcriptional regulator [Candidatus Acidoferrales bacterium]
MSAGEPRTVSYAKAFEAARSERTDPMSARHRQEHAPHIDTLIKLVSVRIVRLSELILRIGGVTFKDRFGVKATDLRILVILGAYQPISVNEVSRRTHIDKAWISRSLRGLLSRKLIKRTAHPSDSRASLLSLTKKGEALLREIAPVAEEYQRQLLQGQRARDVERVLDLLSARAEEMFELAMLEKGRTARRR